MNEIVMRYKRGLFWFPCDFICDDAGLAHCLFSPPSILAYTVPNETQCPQSHKEAWPVISANTKWRSKPWNYYPRGRIDPRKHSILIFTNPYITQCPGFEMMIRQAFGISDDAPIRIIVDNSVHYHCIAADI